MGSTSWYHDINDQIDIYLTQADRENEIPKHRAPEVLYYQGGTTLYWLNQPETKYLDIERSQDGGKSWTVVGRNLDPVEHSAANGIGKFVDGGLVDQTTYRYRVTAVFEDGQRVTSKDTNDNLYWIPPNLVKNPGFEDSQTFVSDTWTGWRSYDTAYSSGATTITDEEAHSGKYSLKFDTLNVDYPGYATVTQYFPEAEANLTYRLIVWRKATEAGYFDIKESYNEPHSLGLARMNSGTGSLITRHIRHGNRGCRITKRSASTTSR